MVENIRLVILSFFASTGFGIVFRMEKKHLPWAGLAGALTRCVYLALMAVIDNRLVYILLAAMFAAAYAEIMAPIHKTPSTVFLYPAIIPLIPGDMVYNTMVGFVLQEKELMLTNAKSCGITLAGMSIGFVIISCISYYKRIYKEGKRFLIGHLPGAVKRRR